MFPIIKEQWKLWDFIYIIILDLIIKRLLQANLYKFILIDIAYKKLDKAKKKVYLGFFLILYKKN